MQPTDCGPQDLLDSSRKLSGQGPVSHLPGNVDNLIKSDVPTVFDIFLLLLVSWWLLEGFDDQGRGTGSLGNAITNRSRGPVLGAKADVLLALPLVYLKYMTSILLGLNLGSMVEAPGVR